MAKKSLLGRMARYTLPTEKGQVTVEIVGRRPDNEPYVWIGAAETPLAAMDAYLDSINEDGMRLLLTALREALNE